MIRQTTSILFRKPRTALRLSVLVTACAFGFIATPSYADVSPALDRVSVSVGGFRAEPKFGARVGTDVGTLDTGEFKTDSVTMPRVKVDVLLFDSQGLSFDYFQYKHTYSQSGSGSFNLGNNQVSAAADASLKAKVEFGKLSYKWWLGSGNTAIGLGAGAGYYKISADGTATATVNGTSRSVNASASEDAVAPLLEVGLRHAITPNLRLIADASGVWKKGGNTHGSIYNAAFGVEWFPVKNVGVMLSYDISDFTLKRKDDIDSRLRMKLHGPSAYVKVRF